MKKLLSTIAAIALCLALSAHDADARGGFSGGGRGGFSGGGRSFSSGRSFSAPRSSGGGFSSRSYSSGSRVTSRTTITRNYYGGGMGYYYHPYMMYPGFGMGYGYSSGLMEGLIIGSLMHPAGTTVYNGGGYSGQALLYPDGRVVNDQGYQVGMYQNGQYTAVDGGQMVAQPAPANPQQAPQQVQVVNTDNGGMSETAFDILMGSFLLIVGVVILAIMFG